MLGKPLPAGGSYFVDQYNHEFSRDIEPLRGDYGDNYYYQMADFIRRFKGTKPSPTFTTTDTIRIDGQTDEWKPVQAAYADDKGDIAFRNHFGYGRMGQLVNTTGRNDIVRRKSLMTALTSLLLRQKPRVGYPRRTRTRTGCDCLST